MHMSQPGISFDWDDTRSHSGRYCVAITCTPPGAGRWQQTVAIEPDCVYALSGFVAFQDLTDQTGCWLGVSFRDSQGTVIQSIDYPDHHSGSREIKRPL